MRGRAALMALGSLAWGLAPARAQCGDPGAGDCCAAGPGPGCADAACCAADPWGACPDRPPDCPADLDGVGASGSPTC